MLNKLFVGLNKAVQLPKRGYLFIGDEVPDIPQARIFDPLKHSFNPLKNIEYKKAREIADILYTVFPQGENTLTVRNGKRALLKLLMERPERLDALPPHEKHDDAADEARSAIADILMSPVLRKALCNVSPPAFSFNPRSIILARINRAELGDLDSLVLGLFLMAHFQGQIVLPDGGFYLRDCHTRLIREGRLITGCNSLSELPQKIRNSLPLFNERIPSRTLAEDAETLARYAGLRPDPLRAENSFNDYVKAAMA